MRHHIYLLALFGSALALPGCGRPEIKVDSTAVATRAGNLPVGLLEVHRARSGDAPGISIGEALDESLYCTGTLLEDGRVLTSADCLANETRRFEASDMEFHLNAPGTNVTRHLAVQSADADPGRPGLAYLRVNFTPSGKERASALSLQRGGLEISEGGRGLEAQTISIKEPQPDGIAYGAASDTTVLYNPNGFAFPVDPPPPERTRRNDPPNPNNGYPGPYPGNYNPGYGYPNNGYPNNGYPNNGYPNNGYPNNGYPNGTPNAYPPNSNPSYPNVPGYGTGPNTPGFPTGGAGTAGGLPNTGSSVISLNATVNAVATDTATDTGPGTDPGTATNTNTSTFTNTSTATDTDAAPFPGSPIPYYPPRTNTNTNTNTNTGTNTNTSGNVAYASLKAVGAEGASWGSPLLVDGRIVGVVKRGGTREAPGTVYWIDETVNQAQGPGEPRENGERNEAPDRAQPSPAPAPTPGPGPRPGPAPSPAPVPGTPPRP